MNKEKLNKPNELISIITDKSISLTQRKAYNIFLKYAQNLLKFEDYKDNVFKIECSLLHKNANINNKNLDYVYKEELENLMTTVVEIVDKDNPKNWKAFTLLSYIEKKDNYYYYELNQFIIHSLIEQNFFTPLNLIIINSLSSQYSIILYELAIRYQKYKIPKMTVEEIRNITHTQKEYKRFYDLKKYVLDAACKEISEKTDIILSYTTEKKGRRISHIDFSIQSKNGQLYLDEKNTDDMFSVEDQNKIRKVVKKIPFDITLKLFEKNKDENFDYLLFCLEKTEERSIQNPVAYFEKMLKEAKMEFETYMELKKIEEELQKKRDALERIRQEEEKNKKNEAEKKIEEILKSENDEYQKIKNEIIFALKRGFLENKLYFNKSEEDIPKDIVEKYILQSLHHEYLNNI
ncbi:MAG: replication initiation protein [Fusobacteriaceae bacterium]|nr:replication initiation protein [Fusobacteriaceae bacterium]